MIIFRSENKAKSLNIFSFNHPHHASFHMSWMGFFVSFVSTFAAAPMIAIIREDLELTKPNLGSAGLAAVTLTADDAEGIGAARPDWVIGCGIDAIPAGAEAGGFIKDEELVAAPDRIAALWRLVDKVNGDLPHFYGGGMFRHPVWGAYYLAPPNFFAPRYDSRRRMTELAAKASGRSPSPTFKAVGADNVSTGSMAGMRCIHYLRETLGAQLAIWPFDNLCQCWPYVKLVLVEIFPSYYFHLAGMVPAKQAAAQAGFLNAALDFYNSAGVPPQFIAKGTDADEADAIIAAAALRYFAQQATKTMFCLPAPISVTARKEGWIFGVDPIHAQPC